MKGIISYLLSKLYVDNSIKGISGVLAGKNCTISKTEEVEGGTEITFSWTADDGTKKTTKITVKNGTQRVRLTSDGNGIYSGSKKLTFEEVKALVMNEEKFVTLTLADNVSFLPSAYDGDAIWFDAGFIEDNVANQLRIIINKDNQVKVDQIELASKDNVYTKEEVEQLVKQSVQQKVLKLNVALSEEGLLGLLATDYADFECSGFFYNTDIDDYCEFEGLYVPYTVGSEVIHFGYCHIKGLHGAEHYADYYIDDEDGETWHKKTVNDYVKISTEQGNALTEKEDGLYVSATGVEISQAEGNIIETKEDGLYAKADDIKISKETGNIIEEKEDGLYAKADDIKISKETGNIIEEKEDGLYVPEATDIEANGEEAATEELKKLKVEDVVYEVKGQTIQVTELPTTSEDGVIVQYIGETTPTATKGYFYKAVVADNAIAWQRIDVQPAPAIPEVPVKTSELQNDGDGTSPFATENDLSDYVEKDGDKVLSTNDFTNEDKAEVAKVNGKLDKSALTDGSITGLVVGDSATYNSIELQELSDGTKRIMLGGGNGLDGYIENNGKSFILNSSDQYIRFESAKDSLAIHNAAGNESRITFGDGELLLEGSPASDTEPKIKLYDSEDGAKGNIDVRADVVTFENYKDHTNNFKIEQSMDTEGNPHTALRGRAGGIEFDGDNNIKIHNYESDEADITLAENGDITITARSYNDSEYQSKITMSDSEININSPKVVVNGNVLGRGMQVIEVAGAPDGGVTAGGEGHSVTVQELWNAGVRDGTYLVECHSNTSQSQVLFFGWISLEATSFNDHSFTAVVGGGNLTIDWQRNRLYYTSGDTGTRCLMNFIKITDYTDN